MDLELMEMLSCPACRESEWTGFRGNGSPEAVEAGQLRCEACEAVYPVRSGSPVLIPESRLSGPEWDVWRRHLAKFQARREARSRNPERPMTRLARRSDAQPAFAEFVGITEGVVLDVGCGPGKFRTYFDTRTVKYVGLDPMILPDVRNFPFVQALAEYLPFRDGLFTDIVVLAALDHFVDLERFLNEARRTLAPGGRLHLLQSVHEDRGPISMVKVVAHKVKDALDDRMTDTHARDVPKHMEEFTRRSLMERLNGAFDLVSRRRYSASWYSPDRLFLSFVPEGAAVPQPG